MDMDDPLRSGPLVEVVDVLGAQEEVTPMIRQGSLQPGKRMVRLVGLGGEEVGSPCVVEGMHLTGVMGEGFWSGQLHRVELGPVSTLVAERAEPALSRNASTGQDEHFH